MGVLLLTVGLGNYLKPQLALWQKIQVATKVTYCELMQNPEKYRHQMVRVRGQVSKTQNYLLLSRENCRATDDSGDTMLAPDEKYYSDSRLKNWTDAISTQLALSAQLKSEAEITGQFGKISDGCWGPMYAITVINIEKIK